METPLEHTFLHRIILNHLIHDIVFRNLTPLEFLRFARTCRLTYAVVQTFVKRCFNINNLLSRYFTDPIAFRLLQARTGTLIAGSAALQFFDRTTYSNSKLALYVPRHAETEVLMWLVEHGYHFVPWPGTPSDLDEAIEFFKQTGFVAGIIDEPMTTHRSRVLQAVYGFQKPSSVEGEPSIKIQCYIASFGPLDVILSSHSTCVMNVISYEKAYCLYPRATLHFHETLVSGLNPSPGRPDALQKYLKRGFKLIRGLGPDTECKFPTRKRFMGDSLSWTLSLDMEGVDTRFPVPGTDTTLSHDPVAMLSWKLVARRPPCNDIEIERGLPTFSKWIYSNPSDEPWPDRWVASK
ncbi:hypothetical protein BXZ70DRAFT_458900 [Cristinia sonorae]|uniref:F-box domain-containing protein n=1 Tax=Cristinia sonorae TaxID=1940300 RepID=A0A8K0UIV0_9AGAR|nr:hypothetical protein BXZ70DRAFT_458900 [Cristinia sonorae]